MTSSALTSASTWSPLRQPVFRALWIASAISTVGTWMHDVAAAWLMIYADYNWHQKTGTEN